MYFLQCYKLHFAGTVPFCVLFICMWYYHSCFYHALLKSFCNKTLSIRNVVASIFWYAIYRNCVKCDITLWLQEFKVLLTSYQNPQWVTVQWSVLTVRSHSTDAVFGVIKCIITEVTIILFYKWRIVCHRLVLFTYIDISITYPVVNRVCFHLNHYTWQA